MLKTVIAVCLIICAIALIAPKARSTTAREIADRERFCRYGSVDGTRTWTDHEVRRTIRCATDRWDVPFDVALAIAERESGLNENALNPSSGACGVFQNIPTYWPGRVAGFNRTHPAWNAGPSCFNPRSNIVVSVRMMASGGFGPWA